MGTLEIKFDKFHISGFLAVSIGLILACFYTILLINNIDYYKIISIFAIVIPLLLQRGLLKIEPNEAVVLVLFGKYKGTLTKNGFLWVNPFYSKYKIPIRARNMNIEPVKVNDKRGNPIMIGAVLIWKIKDTYKASFDIDNKAHDIMMAAENFVRIQSDAALRQMAGMYAYDNIDNSEGNTTTLRSSGDEANNKLEEELNNRLQIAGIEIMEARINYLAYSAEIAGVMLRRQQAEAIIAAREKIVEGAVGIVQMALEKLQVNNTIKLNQQNKIIMTNNLLAILCADEAGHSLINAET
jgi:Membrane protease subunits, stomatin/prohibitin homologs